MILQIEYDEYDHTEIDDINTDDMDCNEIVEPRPCPSEFANQVFLYATIKIANTIMYNIQNGGE
jgi:hypothetical protein